ncbi:MAG TPA: hypothetical protein DEP57_06415 [Selenomonas sp.]|nr:hypothetical protein [Selenomonas sp.]
MNNPYADIIDLPHHVSKQHPQMPMEKRAAQFSPFAAVSGHDEAIHETSRFTEEQLELSDDEIAIIDRNLQWLREYIKEQPEVTVTYFQPDEKKNGGAYVTVTGSAKNVEKVLILQDGTSIPITNIIDIQRG